MVQVKEHECEHRVVADGVAAVHKTITYLNKNTLLIVCRVARQADQQWTAFLPCKRETHEEIHKFHWTKCNKKKKNINWSSSYAREPRPFLQADDDRPGSKTYVHTCMYSRYMRTAVQYLCARVIPQGPLCYVNGTDRWIHTTLLSCHNTIANSGESLHNYRE